MLINILKFIFPILKLMHAYYINLENIKSIIHKENNYPLSYHPEIITVNILV